MSSEKAPLNFNGNFLRCQLYFLMEIDCLQELLWSEGALGLCWLEGKGGVEIRVMIVASSDLCGPEQK